MNPDSVYLSSEMPDRADHLWRYTPWRKAHPTGNVREIPDAVSTPKIVLKTIDGSSLPEGISLVHEQTEFDDLPNEEIITKSFLQSVTRNSKFTLSVIPKFKSATPIVVDIQTEGDYCATHLCLEIGRLAEFELVTVIRGECKWFGLMRTGSTGEGSVCNDVFVNKLSKGVTLRVESISIPRDSQFKSGTVSSGSTLTKADLRYRMFGPGGSLNVLGSILSAGEMSLDHHIEIYHDSPETFSRLDWNSACGGSSKTVGTGMLRVSKGSAGADLCATFQQLTPIWRCPGGLHS